VHSRRSVGSANLTVDLAVYDRDSLVLGVFNVTDDLAHVRIIAVGAMQQGLSASLPTI
jgi:hypothetical protein